MRKDEGDEKGIGYEKGREERGTNWYNAIGRPLGRTSYRKRARRWRIGRWRRRRKVLVKRKRMKRVLRGWWRWGIRGWGWGDAWLGRLLGFGIGMRLEIDGDVKERVERWTLLYPGFEANIVVRSWAEDEMATDPDHDHELRFDEDGRLCDGNGRYDIA
jgi:hypothetical protein